MAMWLLNNPSNGKIDIEIIPFDAGNIDGWISRVVCEIVNALMFSSTPFARSLLS